MKFQEFLDSKFGMKIAGKITLPMAGYVSGMGSFRAKNVVHVGSALEGHEPKGAKPCQSPEDERGRAAWTRPVISRWTKVGGLVEILREPWKR